MFFISHAYVNQIGTFQVLQILWFYKDFIKIVKFFIKSLKVPEQKQAWILKKMYKLLPLSSPEKEWAEYCFSELNLGHISLVVTSRTYFLDCQHCVNVKESISLSIYLYFMYIILCFLKMLFPPYTNPLLNLGI